MSSLIAPESEPQPDCCLLISPDWGGQTTEKDDWTVGAPELIVEVANSSEAIDLHSKKADYQEAGAREYVVVALRQRRIHWFVNRDDVLVDLLPGPDGILRSEVFPGLWLDPIAMLDWDKPRLRAVLELGLASPEHAAFVAELARRRSERSET